jgi:hypothetical protein
MNLNQLMQAFFSLAVKMLFINYMKGCAEFIFFIGFLFFPGLSNEDTSAVLAQAASSMGVLNVVADYKALGVAKDTGYSESDPGGWLNVKKFGATGSVFETTAKATAGSNKVIVTVAGDFKVGQEVAVTRCNIRYMRPLLMGPGEPYSTSRPLGDAVEIRGYDGSGGSWLTWVIEIDNSEPLTYRWKGDISKDWFDVKVPVTYEWQELSGGTEIKFRRQKWEPGNLIVFSARDQLETKITKIEGNVFTLADASNNTTNDAIVKHIDRDAIQKTIDRALKEDLNVFLPAGHYRIPGGLSVINARSIRIEGANAFTTILDISDGDGSCLRLQGGTEVTIRNFSMVGHTGLTEAPKSFSMVTGYGYWPNSLKGCNAVSMRATERVLIENVHVSRMASEAFYAQGPARQGKKEPEQYQKSLTYLRCTVTDCAANAFNNNDRAENTSILYCRVDGAGWHAAEMPARFLKVIGSYFRNTGAITVGDMSHRFEDLNELGCGQAFVCNNVFEGIGRCGGIAVNHGSSQVVISGNVFVNFNGPAITVSSATVRPTLPWYKPDAPLDWGSYPSRSAVITGNIIDMTCTGDKPAGRIGINISASEVTVADNQIYVRGKTDPLVTGIQLSDPALKINVHDNLIASCGTGLLATRMSSRVVKVLDKTTFHEASLPLEWRYTHQYQGWDLLWINDGKVTGSSVIDSYDPSTLTFRLRDPYEMNEGDIFEVFFPGPANWNIHNNTITGCLKPVVLDNYGSVTSLFCDNIIERDGATGVKAAVTVEGLYQIKDNQITGFDEHGSCGLLIMTDRSGKPLPNIYRGNIISFCTTGINEGKPGSLKLSKTNNNDFYGCKTGVKKQDYWGRKHIFIK